MRYFHIDFLRAVSILGMCAIHVYAYRMGSPFDNFFWNWMNFVVVGFIFCSGYVLFAKYGDVLKHKGIFGWYKKRIIRLLVPYYVFLACYVALVALLPSFFHGFDLELNPLFLLQSVFLLEGGLGVSWLPLLFIELMVLFPILGYMWKHRKKWLYVYVGVALMSAIFFTLYLFPYAHYRLVMWLPWSLVIVFSFYAFMRDEKYSPLRNYISYSIIFGLLFGLLYSMWGQFDRSYLLTKNKYPPNVYFLLYATFGSSVVLALSYVKIFSWGYVKRFILFTSLVSYTLFFVHFIVLDFALTTGFFVDMKSPFLLTIVVIVISLGITYLIEERMRIFARVRRVLAHG